MARSGVAMAILVCTSGCVDDGVEERVAPDMHATISHSLELVGEDDYCELLPACGPCSLLCDRDALVEQYVPEHTCVAFVCDLTDGRQIVQHVCHP
jgi:hypothetical protein